MTDNATAPTAKELKKGPLVTLTRPGWTGHSWTPHGFAYPIRFDGNSTAKVLESHFDLWLGDDMVATYGITATHPEKPKPKPKAVAKKPAAKKTAAKK